MVRFAVSDRAFHRLAAIIVLTGVAAIGWCYRSWICGVHAARRNLSQQDIEVVLSTRSTASATSDNLLTEYLPTDARLRTDSLKPIDADQDQLCRAVGQLDRLLDDISLPSLRIGDQAAISIGRATHLERLRIDAAEVSDKGAAAFANLKRLGWLEMSAPRLSDRGTGWIATLPDLYRIDLTGDQLGNETLQHVAECRKLQRLSLSAPYVTSAGMSELTKLTRLEYLWISSPLVDDSCAVHLKGIPSLRTLSLVGTRVTDEICKTISELPLIESVSLYNTQVTDAGLQLLKDKCSSLKSLWPPSPSMRAAAQRKISAKKASANDPDSEVSR